MDELGVAHIRGGYENIYFTCPHCDTENVKNRRTDIGHTRPISGMESICDNCKQKVWLNGDRADHVKYKWFLFDLDRLKREKNYQAYVLSLCQCLEAFFVQALLNKLVTRNPLFRNDDGMVDLEQDNFVRRQLDEAWKSVGFEELRKTFNSEFKEYSTSFTSLGNKNIIDRRKESFKAVRTTNINKLRNKVVHSTAYRPTLAEIEEYDDLVSAIHWLGNYLDVIDTTDLINKLNKERKTGATQ